jgi:hypothetical protein
MSILQRPGECTVLLHNSIIKVTKWTIPSISATNLQEKYQLTPENPEKHLDQILELHRQTILSITPNIPSDQLQSNLRGKAFEATFVVAILR